MCHDINVPRAPTNFTNNEGSCPYTVGHELSWMSHRCHENPRITHECCVTISMCQGAPTNVTNNQVSHFYTMNEFTSTPLAHQMSRTINLLDCSWHLLPNKCHEQSSKSPLHHWPNIISPRLTLEGITLILLPHFTPSLYSLTLLPHFTPSLYSLILLPHFTPSLYSPTLLLRVWSVFSWVKVTCILSRV